MTQEQMSKELVALRRDMDDLKAALFDDEGELTPWAKKRIETYRREGAKTFVSQADIEKEFC